MQLSLEQVKEHFKDAKEVRCLVDNEVYSFDDMNKRGVHEFIKDYWIGLKSGFFVKLYSYETNQLSEIITYKNKDMKITEQQVKDLDNGSTTARQLFPQVFKTELEEGVWYKSFEGMLLNFQGKYSRLSDSGAYGFGKLNKWSENLGISSPDKYNTYEKANLEEVKQRMTEELVRLGFVKGCSFRNANDTITLRNTSGVLNFDNFNKENNWFISIDYFSVFYNGKFATLIVEPTQKEILQAKIKEIQKVIDKL